MNIQISSVRSIKTTDMQNLNPRVRQNSNPTVMQNSNPTVMQNSNPQVMQNSNPQVIQNSNLTVSNMSNQSWYRNKKVQKRNTMEGQEIKQIGRIQVIPLVSIDDSDEIETYKQPSQQLEYLQQPFKSTSWNAKPSYQSTTVNTTHFPIISLNSINQSHKSLINNLGPTRLTKSFSQPSQFNNFVQPSLPLPKELPALKPSLPQIQPPRPLKPQVFSNPPFTSPNKVIKAKIPPANSRGKQRLPQVAKQSEFLPALHTSKPEENNIENIPPKGNMLVNTKLLVEFTCKFPCPVCLKKDKWNCSNETNTITGVSHLKFRCRGCNIELDLSESEVVPDGIDTEISKNMLEIVARAVVGGLSKPLTDKLLATLELPAMGVDLWTRCAKICQATFNIPADSRVKDNSTASKPASDLSSNKPKESESTQNRYSSVSSDTNTSSKSNEQNKDTSAFKHQKGEKPNLNPQNNLDSNVITNTGNIINSFQKKKDPLTSQISSKKIIDSPNIPTKHNTSTNLGLPVSSEKNIEKQLIIQNAPKVTLSKENINDNNNSHLEYPIDVDVVKEELVEDRENEIVLNTSFEPLIVKEEKDKDSSLIKIAHEYAKNEDEVFICSICNYKCDSTVSLIIHMRTHNPSENSDNVENANTAFVCCECNNRFKDSMSLTKHMSLHTDKKKFECTKCSYSCNDRSTLTRHDRKHNEEKPFECTDCDYRTKYKSDLRVHMRGHTGEKLFVCSICQYSCIAASCLKQHMKSKHDKDPYECTECNFTSIFSSNLKLHMKSHIGDKKFICTKCGYKSATNVEHKMHTRTHFVEKRFECTDCEYKSASKATMKVHMLTHQRKKPKPVEKHFHEVNDIEYLTSDINCIESVDKSSNIKRKADIPVHSSDNSKKRKLNNFPSVSSELSIELVDIIKKPKINKKVEDAGSTSSGWNFIEPVEVLKKQKVSANVKGSGSTPSTIVKRKVGRPRKNDDSILSITPVINHPHSIFSNESIDKGAEDHLSTDAMYIESVNICNAAAKFKRVRNVSSASSSENDSSKPKKVCKQYECAYCDFKAKKKSDFKKHVSTHSEENVNKSVSQNYIKDGSENSFDFTCHMCGLEYSTTDDLNAHMSSHDSNNFTELKVQGIGFKNPNNLLKETESVEYWCPECEYKCTNILDLAEHTKGHDDSYIEEFPHKCLICTRRFKEKRQTKIHMRREHTSIGADRKRIFVCSECEYFCQQSGSLKTHMRKHTGEKPFMCRFCPYRCTTKSSLTVHNRTHTGEKPYACSICDFRSTNNSDLKVHVRNHTGEKPYACTECPYACKTSSSLKTHLRIHKGEKPFECPMCNYKCTTSSTLRMHIRTHTGEKPFHCQECGYRCTSGSTLKKHKEIHWRERRLDFLIKKTHTI